MPWEKSFSEAEALTRAMQAFWARGYEATSMQDLVDCMGIGRGSLYATFGDKRRLFLRALDRYDSEFRDRWTQRLAAEERPRAAIGRAFREAADAATGGEMKGCLLVNTALEMAPHDPEVAAVVAGALEAMERFFEERIRAGQAAGEIGAGVEPQDTARTLLALLAGLRVFARSRPDPALVAGITRAAERMLE